MAACGGGFNEWRIQRRVATLHSYVRMELNHEAATAAMPWACVQARVHAAAKPARYIRISVHSANWRGTSARAANICGYNLTREVLDFFTTWEAQVEAFSIKPLYLLIMKVWHDLCRIFWLALGMVSWVHWGRYR